MKKILALVVGLCLAPIGAHAWWQSVAQQSVTSAATYQGPGDVVSGATVWGSCARVYTAAQASTATSLCDLVAITGGAAVCTLRGSSTGLVDLAASYCAGTTPAAACAAASGGACRVTKVYDQTGSGNHFIQAALAQMPALAFAAINSLPVLRCTNAASTSMATGNLTQAQSYSMSTVFNRTGSVTTLSAAIGALSAGGLVGGSTSANTSTANSGANLTRTGNDNAFHAIQGVMNNLTGANNTDGSDTTGSTGGGAFSATALRICRTSSGVSSDMDVAEGGLWPIGFDATQRTNMNANQHGSNGYNF